VPGSRSHGTAPLRDHLGGRSSRPPVLKSPTNSFFAGLLRLRGELLRQHQDSESEAEACFQDAIAVAQDQHAKAWELRATLSLYRLWQRTGRREEARARLAEVTGWFTEGLDAPDLREARRLLGESAALRG
jgi:predicted ATPase